MSTVEKRPFLDGIFPFRMPQLNWGAEWEENMYDRWEDNLPGLFYLAHLSSNEKARKEITEIYMEKGWELPSRE